MRELGAVLSAVTLAVTLGACDPDGAEVATDAAALARSLDRGTAEASTAHVEITATLAGGIEVTGSGDLRIGSDETSMSVDVHSVRGHSRFVVLDRTVYFKPQVGLGGPWLGFDLGGDAGSAQEANFMIRDLRTNADPRRLIERLRAAGTVTAEEEGVELHGAPATHYRITVAVGELAGQEPKLARALERAGVRDFPVEVWVDERGRPVRVRTDAPGLSPDLSETYESSVVVDYTDWGAPVAAFTVPPRDQIQWPPD